MSDDAEALAVDERVVEAVRAGDAAALATLLDQYPDRLHLRTAPYEQSLLHLAASAGHLDVVDLLLERGLDVNTREKGDNTYAMHWAAAAGPSRRRPASRRSQEAMSSVTATITPST